MLNLRRAQEADAELLFIWRNDQETREQSVNGKEVSLSEHRAWLKRTLADPHRQLWIAEWDGGPVGTVRFDFDLAEDPERWELSWTIAPEGRGLGALLVQTAISRQSGPLRARIRAGNNASRKVAERAGFRLLREAEGMTYWVCDQSGS